MSGAAGRRLWTREFSCTLLSVFGLFLGYQPLLVVLPLEVADGGGSSLVVGLETSVFMSTAVLAQLSTPRLLARFRIQPLFLWALILLGMPSLLEPATDSAGITLCLNLVRGAGIGVGSVVGSTAVSLLAPPERRGEALGLFGLMTAMPSAVGSVTALTLLQESSLAVVFVVLGVVTVLACAVTAPIGSCGLAPLPWTVRDSAMTVHGEEMKCRGPDRHTRRSSAEKPSGWSAPPAGLSPRQPES